MKICHFCSASFPLTEISDIQTSDLFDDSPLLCSPVDIQPGLRPAPTSSDLLLPGGPSHVPLPFFQEKPQLELLLPAQTLLKQARCQAGLQSNNFRDPV